MKSKLLATRLGLQNRDFLESLRGDNWLGSGFGSSFSAAPAPQGAAGPLVQSIATPGPQQLAFTAGNIVVYRIGDGGAALTNAATAVFLDEYTTAGVYVQTVIMPTTDGVGGVNNQMLTASGTSTAEGLLNRSVDGRYLFLTGYDAPTGTASINGTTGSAFPRVVGRVAADGTFDTSTRLTDFASSSSPRSATSIDGTDIWITGGAGGIRHTTVGATSSTQLATTPTNFRSVEIFDGQLYISAMTGTTRIATVGSGVQTTTGQTVTNVPGAPTTVNSPYGFFFANLDGIAGLDTLYVCDDSVGLLKYSLVSGSWVSSGTIGVNADDYFGLTGSVSGTTVTLYATRLNGAAADTIVSVIDTSGFGGTLTAAPTTLVTAAANTAFRGLDFAPTPGGPVTPTLTVDNVTMAEGDTGTVTFIFTVSLSAPAGPGGVTFDIATADGTAQDDNPATEDNDYVAISLTGQTIPAGSSTYTFNVTVNADNAPEPNETFFVNVTNVTGATVGDGIGLGTINNDDTPGTLAINDVTLAEGNSGNTAFTFTVTRSGGSEGTVGATWTLNLPGGANADAADFDAGQSLTGSVSFADGDTSETITVQVKGDAVVEPDEGFTITLSAPTGGATITDDTGAGTITNDDSPPVASIADAALAEGDGGVTYLVFTVTLDHASNGVVTYDYDTSGGSAIEGSDFLGVSGQVSFAPGETSQTISVPIVGDEAPENNETLTVTLSNPSGGSIGDGTATGTITNDDGSGYYSLASSSFTQAWTTTTQITADDNWSGVPFIVGYLGDIDPGGDTTNVDPRTLTGSALGAIDVIANQASTGISNGGVGEFEITNPTVGLQGSGTADAPSLVLYMDATGRSSVRLQANLRDIDANADDAAQQVNVQYRTSPGGAWTNVPGAYFSDVTTGGTATQVTVLDVILPAGADNAPTLEIRIMTTNAAGSDEWVGIDDIIVSSAVSGPSLSIANAAVFEGDAGPTIITFTVTRAGTSTGEVTADYELIFGSGPFAAGTDDFTALSPLSGQVSFADGETTATITVSVDGDIGPEGDENFTVLLSNPSAGATIADGTATGTIVNDDGPPPLVTINDVTVTEGNAGTSLMTFTVTRTGGTGAFDVDWETADATATEPSDYVANSGTIHFADGQMSDTVTVAITINGDTDSELSETLSVTLSNATNFALITDAVGIGTIAGDDPIFIHDIQGTAYYSPILAGEGVSGFNIASAGSVLVRAIVTAVDNDGPRQGYYLSEEVTDWDGNSFTSEGIFVMTRNDAGVGNVVAGVSVGDLVQVSAQVMEYQAFDTMPRTILVNSTDLSVISSGNLLPTLTLTNMPNAVMTLVTPDYTDSSDSGGDTFDASLYALSYFETVEGMLVTIPNMVVADGFVSTSGGDPFFQAYSLDSANGDQINSRGGYTIAGDPPIGPPDTATTTGDDTIQGGRHLHDGDVNPDTIELDFTGFAMTPPTGLTQNATMGDMLGDVTGIIDFDFTDRKLFVTAMEPGGFVDGGSPTQEVTVLGDDTRSLTVATFNVENLDPGDGPARFTALANAIANNLNAPDIISIEEMQDNNGATSSGGADASTTWQMLVDALNLATGAHYQWVDQEPNAGTEGGEPGGNIRVGFLYNTDRVQLGDLAANATLAERRMYTDRIGDGVRDAGDLIAFSDNMLGGEINTADWAGTRRSLLGEFTFNGNIVYVTANHWPAKGGSGEFWQFDQNLETGDPDNSGWSQRNQVAQDVYSMMNLIQSTDAEAGIVAGGDFNDFYFYRPLTTLTGHTLADGTARVGGARFENLTLTLAEAERYTYTFDGRSQAIDHIIANSLLGGVATYDVVHLNTGYNGLGTDPSLSDHDPALSSFDFRNFSEILVGTAGSDSISGFGGNDVIVGGGGNDTMSGGLGNDVFYVQDSGDVVTEAVGEGTDRVAASVGYALIAGAEVELLEAITLSATNALNLSGNEFANTIIGNNGANVIDGGAGNDRLEGAGGDDILVGGTGDDNMFGNLGNDIYYVDSAADVVDEHAGEGTDRVAVAASYVLDHNSEVELLEAINRTATDALDITGSDTANRIAGNDGANVLDGGAGNDVLEGGGGGDVLIGGTGADTMFGGLGNDIYYVDNPNDLVFEQGGTDRIVTSVSYALYGNESVEILEAITLGATDPLNLSGNSQNNTIIGNAGDNVISTGGGSDILVGAGGNDTFLFTHVLNSFALITDFDAASDTIQLDHNQFMALTPGALPASAFVIGTQAQDTDDRIIYDPATGNLYYDRDGFGGGGFDPQVLIANLQGAPTISASDFFVI